MSRAPVLPEFRAAPEPLFPRSLIHSRRSRHPLAQINADDSSACWGIYRGFLQGFQPVWNGLDQVPSGSWCLSLRQDHEDASEILKFRHLYWTGPLLLCCGDQEQRVAAKDADEAEPADISHTELDKSG
jgi:hypothetical protein